MAKKQPQDVPVYLFTGFLEAGKTRFMQETLEDERFNTGEPMLLLVCEEGEEEYEPASFAHPSIFIETIEDEDDLTSERLASVLEKNHCQSVMVEYNGMWMLDRLYQVMPEGWSVVQEFFFADATTILGYSANMPNLVADKLKSCDLAVFNRFPEDADKMPYHKLVRTFSRRAEIAYEGTDGRAAYDDIEDPPPYDMNAPVIEIGDDAYAYWYRDLNEQMELYDKKTVRVKIQSARTRGLSAGEFVGGRPLMTCCAADTQFAGLIFRTGAPTLPEEDAWFIVEAKIALRSHKVYGRTGPVLQVVSLTQVEEPEDPVATFYN